MDDVPGTEELEAESNLTHKVQNVVTAQLLRAPTPPIKW